MSTKTKQALFAAAIGAVIAVGRLYGCDTAPQPQPDATGMPIVISLPDVEVIGSAGDVTATWLPDAQTAGAQ